MSQEKNVIEYSAIVLPMAYRTPYPLYFDHPIHEIVKPHFIFNCESSKIAMEYRTPHMIYWTPYSWYIEHPTCGISDTTTHDILTLPTHEISNPLLSLSLLVNCNSMEYWPSPMVYLIPYPWYCDPRLLS